MDVKVRGLSEAVIEVIDRKAKVAKRSRNAEMVWIFEWWAKEEEARAKLKKAQAALAVERAETAGGLPVVLDDGVREIVYAPREERVKRAGVEMESGWTG